MITTTKSIKTCSSDEKDLYDYISKPFYQLCWNCKRVLKGNCEWSLNLVPKKDWDAIEETVRGQKSYYIFKCPDFEPIHPPLIKNCYNCGKEFESHADNCFCSSLCFAKYNPRKYKLTCQKCKREFDSPTEDRRFCTSCLYQMRRKGKEKGEITE